jgi:Leucine-rich repeat (LRR) protein
MPTPSVIDYASSPGLTPDEIYTLELLLEKTDDFTAEGYWDASSKRSDARRVPDYQPSFDLTKVATAWPKLQSQRRISFQRLNASERPLRDLQALRYLPFLRELIIENNEVSNLDPLRNCLALKQLSLASNPIRDISALAGLTNLEELDVRDTSIDDFSVLQFLPKLKCLEVSVAQLPLLGKVPCIPSLMELNVRGSEQRASFRELPLMPKLRGISGASVKSLSGLEKFPALCHLTNLSGSFNSLEPLRGLKCLSHVNAWGTKVTSLEPLTGCIGLRDFYLASPADSFDVSPLTSLPLLRQLRLNGEDVTSATLPNIASWDRDFYSRKPRYTAALNVEIVDQATFDFYDGIEPYGLTDEDTNEALLLSESDWLETKLAKVFPKSYVEEEDYALPMENTGARSKSVAIISKRAVKALKKLILGMQNVLCHARHDWILFLECDDESDSDNCFRAWIYPTKIQTTVEHEHLVRKLLS